MLNAQHSTPRCMWLVALTCFCAVIAQADVSVVASVDRNHVAFGESVTLTISVQGAQDGAEPSVPRMDGLSLAGPSTQTSVSIVNAEVSQSISFAYQVTPHRMGEFTIPAIEVKVGGKKYSTEPIEITVEKVARQPDMQEQLFGRVQFNTKPLYMGQVAPLDVYVFVRQDLRLSGLGGYQAETSDGLNYKYLQNAEVGATNIDGQVFHTYRIIGAVGPSKVGQLVFGPCVLKGRQTARRQPRSWFEEATGGNIETRELTASMEPVPIEVLPLPEEGRPPGFASAIGQWNLEATAKPTEVAVGDPITWTIKVTGKGNIDTVPALTFGLLDGFKTYDPTTKTTKDELNTVGERVFQQVLIPKNAEVKELPEVRLAYFDPVAKAYKVARQQPIRLMVKAGNGGQTTIVSGGHRLRTDEKLGQDIVYLKGDLGPAAPVVPFCSTPMFWTLNFAPVLALVAGIGWKRRRDKLRGDVAYARRSRAARNARKLLASSSNYDEVQHALQNYLGDRLNIPAGGITGSIVDEQLVPRGVNGELAVETKRCFEACDTARFAGGRVGDDVTAVQGKVERLIDELEKKQL